MHGLRIAVLAKQVPQFGELRIGPDGRLVRDPAFAEINPYCRRAIAKGTELARVSGGSCTVVTLGPPSSRAVLEEAIAWGADAGVQITGPEFAGSDTLVTARALAAALGTLGPLDLIVAGLNSVDADTGQVGPQLAEMLGLPFLGGVREMDIAGTEVRARCEIDDGYLTARVRLPAVLTAAERLCAPAKVPEHERRILATTIRELHAADLGPGPWGAAASPTQVGEARAVGVARRCERARGALAEQVSDAARAIVSALAGESRQPVPAPTPRASTSAGDAGTGPVVAVLAEPGRTVVTRELLSAAAGLAEDIGGQVVLLAAADGDDSDPVLAWSLGASETIWFKGTPAKPGALPAEDFAAAVASWAVPERTPWAILAPGTSWGREAAARLSVRLDAGLVGDAVGLEVADGRLVCWKPAFGGQLLSAITVTTPVQLVTVRPGVLPPASPRGALGAARLTTCDMAHRSRVVITGRERDGEPGPLLGAQAVVAVGSGVDPARYGELQPLLTVLGAELAGTRKVTDAGWLPRSRQIGITGHAVAPRVYLLLAASGKLNHMIATRGAGLVVAVNSDPAAPVFDAADIGINADWSEVASLLIAELTAAGIPQPVIDAVPSVGA
jgi:electron transfer flavoprotein alpha subunit